MLKASKGTVEPNDFKPFLGIILTAGQGALIGALFTGPFAGIGAAVGVFVGLVAGTASLGYNAYQRRQENAEVAASIAQRGTVRGNGDTDRDRTASAHRDVSQEVSPSGGATSCDESRQDQTRSKGNTDADDDQPASAHNQHVVSNDAQDQTSTTGDESDTEHGRLSGNDNGDTIGDRPTSAPQQEAVQTSGDEGLSDHTRSPTLPGSDGDSQTNNEEREVAGRDESYPLSAAGQGHPLSAAGDDHDGQDAGRDEIQRRQGSGQDDGGLEETGDDYVLSPGETSL